MIAKFRWNSKSVTNRYCAFKNWKSIYNSKEFGGLGFRSVYQMNQALLAKLG